MLRNYIAGRMLTQYCVACFEYELFLYVIKRIKTSTQSKLLMVTLANIMVPLQMEKCTSERGIVQRLLQRAWHFVGEV